MGARAGGRNCRAVAGRRGRSTAGSLFLTGDGRAAGTTGVRPTGCACGPVDRPVHGPSGVRSPLRTGLRTARSDSLASNRPCDQPACGSRNSRRAVRPTRRNARTTSRANDRRAEGRSFGSIVDSADGRHTQARNARAALRPGRPLGASVAAGTGGTHIRASGQALCGSHTRQSAPLRARRRARPADARADEQADRRNHGPGPRSVGEVAAGAPHRRNDAWASARATPRSAARTERRTDRRAPGRTDHREESVTGRRRVLGCGLRLRLSWLRSGRGDARGSFGSLLIASVGGGPGQRCAPRVGPGQPRAAAEPGPEPECAPFRSEPRSGRRPRKPPAAPGCGSSAPRSRRGRGPSGQPAARPAWRPLRTHAHPLSTRAGGPGTRTLDHPRPLQAPSCRLPPPPRHHLPAMPAKPATSANPAEPCARCVDARSNRRSRDTPDRAPSRVISEARSGGRSRGDRPRRRGGGVTRPANRGRGCGVRRPSER